MARARLQVKVVPGASRSRITGRLGDALKVSVTAQPERGEANAAVEELLAAALGILPRAVTVVSGHGSARKIVEINGMSEEDVHERLLKGK
jgi:uncharacterized protein